MSVFAGRRIRGCDRFYHHLNLHTASCTTSSTIRAVRSNRIEPVLISAGLLTGEPMPTLTRINVSRILFATVFIAAVFLSPRQPAVAQQTALPTSTPVENEPLHKVLFQNDSVIVLKLTLPPGQSTQFHTHTHDRVAIELSTAEITQQKMNEPEGPRLPPNPATLTPSLSLAPLTPTAYTTSAKLLTKFSTSNFCSARKLLPPR